MPDGLITVVYFFVALFPLVLIHELGHFLLAKLGGVRVEEFGIGFPPRAVTLFRLGETDYTLNWLPIGGFVRLSGEDDPTIPGALAAASKRVRSAVLLAGPVFNFLFAALLLGMAAVVWGTPEPVAEDGAVAIVSVQDGSPADAAGIEPGDVIVAIDGRPLAALPEPSDAEPGTTRAMAALRAATRASDGQPLALTLVRGIDEARAEMVDAPEGLALGAADLGGLPALAATDGAGALRSGDLVVGPPAVASGERAPAPGETLAVVRGPVESLAIAVTPDDGLIGIGIQPLTANVGTSLVAAPWYGLRQTWRVIDLMVTGLADMVTGRQATELAGPVGIARMGRQAGEQGLGTLVAFMALLSVNLGVINLLPIPGLDGGRLLFVAFEALRGRRVEPTREAVVHFVGIALVIGLMLVITAFEVIRPVMLGAP
jgi:regulator of sigma E protease